MSTITGTIKSATLLRGPDNQSATRSYLYQVNIESAATTAGDTGTVASVASAIATTIGKSGKSLTLRQAMGGIPGVSDGGTAVYATGVTVSTTSINYSLGGPTAVAAVAGCSGVALLAVLDEA